MVNYVTDKFRGAMVPIAKWLNKITNGKLTPNMVTLISFLGHILVFVAIIDHRFILAAGLLVFFGLLDALDGALARVQRKSSPSGMLLDATSDRAKEAIIYAALIYVFADSENVLGVMASVTALSGSFMVSYVKAKGETAIASSAKSHSKVNKKFASGLMQYQVRMLFIVVGLVFNILTTIVSIIAVMAWFTALVRLVDITEALQTKSKK